MKNRTDYPFSDDLVFCEKHSSTSDVIDVMECKDCKVVARQKCRVCGKSLADGFTVCGSECLARQRYGTIKANLYIKRLRKPAKVRYALQYLDYKLNGESGPCPEHGLTYMGAQAIRLTIDAGFRGAL